MICTAYFCPHRSFYHIYSCELRGASRRTCQAFTNLNSGTWNPQTKAYIKTGIPHRPQNHPFHRFHPTPGVDEAAYSTTMQWHDSPRHHRRPRDLDARAPSNGYHPSAGAPGRTGEPKEGNITNPGVPACSSRERGISSSSLVPGVVEGTLYLHRTTLKFSFLAERISEIYPLSRFVIPGWIRDGYPSRYPIRWERGHSGFAKLPMEAKGNCGGREASAL